MISDTFAKQFGMRGRLWWLWSCQTIAGLLCVGLGLAYNSFTSTMIVLCFFSFFVQVNSPAPDTGPVAISRHSRQNSGGSQCNAMLCRSGPLYHHSRADLSS